MFTFVLPCLRLVNASEKANWALLTVVHLPLLSFWAAAVDVLGFLPGPVSKNNAGAADLLAGELFAYAVSSGVAVVDVSTALKL